ncbi:MAG: hypothetical protein JWO66_568 [Candidatus Eremiobacteraeota bacterium]|nr:hypothetical protein [Candidatus Eremiobacteraeota bacterium]
MVASIFGTIVGLGGAFVVVPVLRIFFGVPPAEAAGTSLAMVLANTAAAAVGYMRQKMIDVRFAIPFTVGAVPGSILGVLAVKRFSPSGFDLAYGIQLIFLAALVIRRRSVASRPAGERTWAHDPRVGVIAGVGVGLFSSMFGIGGGAIMIPLLLVAARMPPHVVVATSAFVITTTSPVGVVAHALGHDIDWVFALPLIAGGLVGGSLGPPLARRIASPVLITLLAGALILAAISLALRHIF